MEDSAQGGKTLRREIAVSTRILQAQGILGYSGHVSARLPDGSGFLIQPRKTSRAEVTPEDILTVDNEGIQTGGPTDDTPPGEVAIHVAILKARPEVGAAIHFHPKAATLFSMVEDVVLAPMKNHAYRWRGGIPVHPDSSPIKTHAVEGAAIITLVTRAREAFLDAAMIRAGAHIDAVGSISPEREELSQDIFPRCSLIACDSVPGIQKLSKEFMTYYDGGKADWAGMIEANAAQ